MHCVDTEGPLVETLEATFERLSGMYGIDLSPDRETLRKLQNREVDVGSAETAAAVATTFAPENLAYMEDWGQLDAMLDRFDAEPARLRVPDSDGGGWVANWHCVAHHGFDPARNPRHRHYGVHTVFDHYQARTAAGRWGDAVHWHFHPVAPSRQANHSATAYFQSPEIFEIIGRRIVERGWFPCVNRPGFHSERPDSHWFLEQWMPFDYANCNVDAEALQADQAHGRFGDWRRAPDDWVVYRPSHDDHQIPGNCRRAVARCLYLGGRFHRLTQTEVDKAFLRARAEPTILSFCNHDYRDLIADMATMQDMLADSARRHPDVHWRFAEAAEAMRAVLSLNAAAPHARIDLTLAPVGPGAHLLTVRSDRPPFGPQPWLAYATRDGRIRHDNLDIGAENIWHFTFDDQTARHEDLSAVGVAMNTAEGRTTVVTLDPTTGRTTESSWN